MKKFIPVNNANEYTEATIYYYDKLTNSYKIFKKPGKPLSLLCSSSERNSLFVCIEEHHRDTEAKMTAAITDLRKNIRSGNIDNLKDTITNVVNYTFSEPRSGRLSQISKVVNVLVDEYINYPQILLSLARLSSKDYTTVVHSINVMAYTLGYCIFKKYSEAKTKEFGLSSLLHDIGKTEISDHILKSKEKLTEDQFDIIKKHPIIGVDILSQYSFPVTIINGCFEHHERFDGSGYPRGLKGKEISYIGKLLGIIDPYEAMTASNRPYKESFNYEEALEKIYVNKAGIDETIFFDFIKATGVITKHK